MEELIDKVVNRVKANADISDISNPRIKSLANVIFRLNSLPKARIEQPNFSILREKILHKISVKEPVTNQNIIWSFFHLRSFRITAGLVGSFLIVSSLAMGTAVAALDSLPGQTLYPLKKVAESIQLRLIYNESDRADLQVKFAQNRIQELEDVLQQTEEGKISSEDAQKIVAQGVKEVQKTSATAVGTKASAISKANIVSKLATLNDKLKTASIKTEGQVQLEFKQALANLERAGLKVEDSPIDLGSASKDPVTAYGKLTVVNETSVSIGTAKFLLTKETKFNKIKPEELKAEQVVGIKAEVKDNKTYALEITLIEEKTEVKGIDAQNSETPAPVENQ